MRAGTHHADETKQALGRARGRAWQKNRDVNVLRAMEEARLAALPPRKLPGERVCLQCGGAFVSTWCGNRLCKACVERSL